MNCKKIFFAISALFLFLGVNAQDALPAENSGDVSAKVDKKIKESPSASEYSGDKLEAIEVKAYAFADNILDLPVNANVLDSAKILSAYTTSMPDILRKEGNLFFRTANGSSSSGQISMRGYGENSQSRVLVLVDGQRMNPSDMGAFNWLQIDPSEVENIEILRGAQSAIYGNNAVAGVIKITTKRSVSRLPNFSMSYGDYDEWSGNFGASIPFDEGKQMINANFNYYSDGGYRANSESRRIGGGASYTRTINDANKLVASFNYSTEYLKFPGPLNYRYFQNNPRASTASPGDSDSNYGVYSLAWDNANAYGEGSLPLSFNSRDMRWNMFGNLTDNWQGSLNFSPKYRLFLGENDKSYVEGGWDFNFDTMDVKLYPARGALGVRTDMDRISLGPWVNGRLQLTDALSFNASARLETAINSGDSTDHNNAANSFSDNNIHLGPAAQFGINYKVDESFSVYARFDQFYRYPSFDEIAAYVGYGSLKPYNAGLEPEYGQNYELGINYVGKKNLKGLFASASAFYSYTNNEISYVYDPASFMGSNENIDAVSRYGLDLNLSYETDFAGASTSWSFVNAEFNKGTYKGNEIPLVPSIVGTSQIWVAPLNRDDMDMRIALLYTWTSSMYMGGDFGNIASQLEDFGTLDFKINYRLKGSFFRLNLFFSIDNLLDENYATYAYYGAGFGDTYYPAAGRRFRVGFQFNY